MAFLEKEKDIVVLQDNMLLSLSIDKCKIKGKSIMEIDNIITLNISYISQIILEDVKLSDIGCILLRDALIKNTSVKSIYIEGTISDIQAIILSEVINSDYISKGHGNKTITEFSIYIKDTYNDDILSSISKIGIRALLQALNKNNFIVAFRLTKESDKLSLDSDDVVDLISNIIETNVKLLYLDISALINFLEFSISSIITLNRFGNSIKNNKTLLKLSLVNCNPTTEILNGLQHNITLEGVELSVNLCGDIKALANLVKFNNSLKYISLYNCFDINEIKIFMDEGIENSSVAKINILYEDEDMKDDNIYRTIEKWYKTENEFIEEFYALEYGDTNILITDSYIESVLNLLSKCKNIHSNIFTVLLSSKKVSISNDNKTRILKKYENIMNNNINVYRNTFWNPWEHLSFRNLEFSNNYITFECHKLVMTTLVCNSYLQNKLSIYLWQYIFSFYQKKQFLSR